MNGASTFEPGAQLGRYSLVRPIASGGMATVWAARLIGTRGFQKVVAVKIMHPSLREEPDAERMFLAEARLVARIRHTNVAEVLDLGEDGGALYLVMEWVHGAPLSAVLSAAQRQDQGQGQDKGLMPPSVAVRIARHIAAGLHAAHTLTDDEGNPIGLVHRDVSPQNVLVGFNGLTKVVDFGVAKVTSEVGSGTRFGQVKGKVAYMAPEQLRAEPLDARVDVFATGILLYMMTTGVHPFRPPGEQRDAVQLILSEEPPVSPSRLVKGYPPRLEAIVLCALQKDRSLRFESAGELEDALSRVLPPSTKEADTVREYVRDLLPGAYQEGIELARAALNPFEGLVTSSSVSNLAKLKPPSSSTLRAAAVSTDIGDEGSGVATLVPPVPERLPMGQVDVGESPPPREWRPRAMVIGAASAVVAASVGLLLWPAPSDTSPAASSPVPAVDSALRAPDEPDGRQVPPAVDGLASGTGTPPPGAAPVASSSAGAPAASSGAPAGQGQGVTSPPRGARSKPGVKAPAETRSRRRDAAKISAEGLKDPY